MSAIPGHLMAEFRETFLFAAEASGLDAGIEAVARAGAAFLRRPACTSLPAIIRKIADYNGIDPTTFVHGGRERTASHARQVGMWILHQLGYSLHEIGRSFAGKDHTTVLYGIRTVERDPKRLELARSILDGLKVQHG